MLRSKEIQEQMRKKVIEIYQSGKGYKAISKALGLQPTSVASVKASVHDSTIRKRLGKNEFQDENRC